IELQEMFAVGAQLVELRFELGEVFPRGWLRAERIEALVIDVAILANGGDGFRFTRFSDVVRSFVQILIEARPMFAKLCECSFARAEQSEERRGILPFETLLHLLRRDDRVVVFRDDAA